MPDNQSYADSFVAAVRRRLNRHRLWTQAVRSFALGAVVMLVVALTYVLRGHSVPPHWYAAIGLAAAVLALLFWLATRLGNEHAAHFTDEHFDLQDSVSSCRHFAQSGKRGGFYDLQSQQTGHRIAQLQPADIPYRVPHRAVAVAGVVGLAAILLGFKAPTEAVTRHVLLEQQMLAETRKINEQLEALIDGLEQQLQGTEEEQLVDSDKLREWVKQLKETKDRKQALRQYGQFERRIADASSRLTNKRDEQLLQRAANELEQERNTQDLAKELKHRQYQQAAEQLDQMRPSPGKKLDEQRKELARLKSAAQRMATAARSANSDSPTGDPRAQPKLLPVDDDLAQLLKDLEAAIQDWDKALQDAILEEMELGDCEALTLEECELCEAKAGDELDKLILRLCKLGHKNKAQLLLAQLCRASSQRQSALSSPMAGGDKAGWGTNPNRREETDPLLDNGQYTQLLGAHGQGPSTVTVEDAADGNGAVTRRASPQNREFRRQVESFVQREDIPEDVKSGVKEYFKNIHGPQDRIDRKPE